MNTREEWLTAAVNLLKPLYGDKVKFPEVVRVSIGFPPKKGLGKRRVLGVCCSSDMAADRYPQIYINPTITEVGGKEGVLSVLAHELIHACGISGHGKEFRAVGLYIGLEGNMASSVAGESLVYFFEHIQKKLGSFPHAYLSNVYPNNQKPDRCRMMKCVCDKCGYTIRVSRKWIDLGIPNCPICNVKLEKEQ